MHLFSIIMGKYSLSGISKVPVVTKTCFQRISALEFLGSKGAAGSPCMLLFHCLQCSGKAFLSKGENVSDLKINSALQS